VSEIAPRRRGEGDKDLFVNVAGTILLALKTASTTTEQNPNNLSQILESNAWHAGRGERAGKIRNHQSAAKKGVQ